MIGPFSIDAVFPAFPLIGARFGVDSVGLQQMISVYLITYAAMSLFHGAISDAIGRKPVIVAGMLVYALASAGAALSTSYGMLLTCRALQGMCAGAGLVVGRAVVRDSLAGGGSAAADVARDDDLQRGAGDRADRRRAIAVPRRVARYFLGTDGVHPVAGRGLDPVSRRSAIHPKPGPRSIPTLVRGYLEFGRDRQFWPLLISCSVNFAGLFLYISSAPRIVRDLLHLSAQGFPWLFLPVVTGLVIGAWLSGRLASRRSVAFTVNLGYGSMLAACAFHLLAALVSREPTLPWSMLPLVLHGVGSSWPSRP